MVSAARTKLLWYFLLTNSFEIPGYVWNLCLFFRCLCEARWASHEQIDWHVTLQCTQLHSFLSLFFATICLTASWLSFPWIFAVNSNSSFGGNNGGIAESVCAGGWSCGIGCIWWTCCPGGGIAIHAIGLYLFTLSTCLSLVTCNSHSSNVFDKHPQIKQFKSIFFDLIRNFSWFLCFL